MVWACRTLCALAVLLVVAAPARAASKTATAGEVRATVSWKASGPYPSNLRIKIVRAGRTLLNQRITQREAGDRYGPRPGAVPVAVRDMDLDGEPEILVDAYSGGAHCCTTTKLWFFERGAYHRLEHDWGNEGYEQGATLLLGGADWSYAFGSYAASVRPVKVVDARLRDVTAQHPRLVERQLRELRVEHSRNPSAAVLAAIIADLHSLGCHAEADGLRPWLADRDKRVVDELIAAGGYRSRNIDRAVSTICGS